MAEWTSHGLPGVDFNHAAYDSNGTARLSVRDDEHINSGREPFTNPTSEAPAVSDEGMRGDAMFSGTARTCTCPICLDLHTNWFASNALSSGMVPRHFSCRLPACDWTARGLDGATASRYTNALLRHEESHFGRKGRYVCLEEHCQYVTKRWGDLTRHYGSKHCTNNVRRFMCPVLWCKYSRAGFARKDKLQSHVRKVHRGEAKSGVGAGQAIRPKGQDGVHIVKQTVWRRLGEGKKLADRFALIDTLSLHVSHFVSFESIHNLGLSPLKSTNVFV
ncbi:hypothetical protein IMSHALPRED_007673 [Imshaugia aleurites]|uniref:C2H2-type domain-containing protein n=1 Tax=Imshaugia aleurites TaxID=172621 RepID=A0A8H3FW80_9LECA|nr:hypothetical protein IMSHALPRED_007673 [Imshaugia aleurites]